ncbi:importin-5-like [Fagus crenata]
MGSLQMDHRMELEQVIEAEILVDNSNHFDTMIKQLMSSDDELHYMAESCFKICKQVDPGTLSLKLARLLIAPRGTDHARAIAAILLSNILMYERSNRWSRLEDLTLSKLKTIRLSLQNLLTSDGSDLWPRLGDLTQSNLKTILFSPFQGEGMILTHFMSSSNELHYMAKTHFDICKQINPDVLSLNLALLLTAPRGTDHARAMSTILLRNLLFMRDNSLPWPRHDHSVLWPQLDNST